MKYGFSGFGISVALAIVLLLGFSYPILSAQSQSTGYPDLDLYYSQLEKNSHETISMRTLHLMKTIPHDSLIIDYMNRGAEVVRDTVSLFNLYRNVTITASEEERLQLLDEISATARKYNRERLRLVGDYFKASMMKDNREELFEAKMKSLEEIVRKSQKAGDGYIELLAMSEVFILNSITSRYARSFAYAQRYESMLDNAADNIPIRGSGYIGIGRLYYDFMDYDRALPLLYKGLSIGRSIGHPYQAENLVAWNYLAVYHKQNNNLDSAAYYNRAIISSKESLSNKPDYLGIAISNLGRVEQAKGNYDAAIAMLEAGLEVMKQRNDLTFVVGLYISLGEVWLAKGDLAMVKKYIDNVYTERPNFSDADWQRKAIGLFKLESNYYAHIREYDLSKLYLDSVLIATQKNQQYSGSHHILLGQQQLQEAEINLKSHQVTLQKNIINLGIVILVIILVAMLLLIQLYRKKSAAYKVLANKAEEWAHKVNTLEQDKQALSSKANGRAEKESVTEEEMRIMSLVEYEMSNNYTYRDATLTAESLADHLGIHRNSLSRAINKVTGDNFNHYVNSYRIREAVRLLSENGGKKIYIDELYDRVGFNSHTSFYRAFKQFTSLSPVEFRRNRSADKEK